MSKDLTRDLRNIRRPDVLKAKARKQAKLGLYLNPNFIFSYNGYSDFILTAVRGIGKTVIGLEVAIILKNKYGWDNVKCYYFRTSDASIKALLTPEKAVDPYLVSKYDMEVTKKRNQVFDHGRLLYEAYSLTTAANVGKGVNLYDCNWWKTDKKRFIVTIWDEFMQDEGVGKRSIGDPVKQYMIYREAIFRDAPRQDYNAVYNIFLANNVSECANVTGQLFGYIPKPDNHKRVKLTRKKAIFWNVPITEEKKTAIKQSYNSAIISNEDPNYNEVKRDMSLLKEKKVNIHKVTALIKFSKFTRDWYCVYDGKYIRAYKNESLAKGLSIAMYRNIDEVYNPDNVKSILDMNDTRGFMFCDLMSMASFNARMKEFKSK